MAWLGLVAWLVDCLNQPQFLGGCFLHFKLGAGRRFWMEKLQGASVRIMSSTLIGEKKNICFRNILLPVSFQVNVLSGASQVFVSDPQYSENTMEQGN